MKIVFKLNTETKTCYRFEAGERPDQITLYLKKKQVDEAERHICIDSNIWATLYLKKKQVDEAGIDPKKGITITVEEGISHD